MSRRHPRYWVHSEPLDLRKKHDPGEDEQPDVVARLCPNPACNRAYLKAARSAAAELQAAHELGRPENPVIVEHGVKPTGGKPVWCQACRDRIVKALGRLPDLAAAVHVVGPEAPRVLRRVVDRGPHLRAGEVAQVPVVAPGDVVVLVEQPDWWWDRLDCHHLVTYPAPRSGAELRRLPAIRRCARCLVDSTQVGAGRIATSSLESDQTRRGTRTGSPSGSPALDMVEYVAAWAGDWVDELAEHLAHATRSRRGVRPRITHLSQHVDYLLTHASALLCADGLAERAGREALDLADRLEKAAGQDRLRHRLPATCPDCDRRALVRDDGKEQVDCRACGARWTWDDYKRLTVVLADEQRRREAGA